MAVLGELNVLGQQRLDVPHLRMLESGVRGDFDALGYMLVGETPMVIKGFEILSAQVGAEATTITFNVAGSKVIHPLSSESGSIFAVPSNRPIEILDPLTNPKMQGSIQPNSTNFIGIDLKRTADPSTADTTMFLDPSLDIESAQRVPLRRTLDYVWVISQTSFEYNKSVCPVAIVVTNNQNTILSITDARPLLGRLTPGGAVTNAINIFGWPGGRVESATNAIAGDKALRSLKDVVNAIETRLWELGGGEAWFGQTADRNVNIRLGATTFSSTGQSFEIVAGNLHWQGVSFTFDLSPVSSVAVVDRLTSVAGLTDLASGECIYCDLNRTSTAPITAQKGQLTTLGLGQKPGSRWVIASRLGPNYYAANQPWPIGSSFGIATTTNAGAIKTNIDFAGFIPIAATIGQSGASGGLVTAAGISHNLDVGIAHNEPSAASDLVIGRASGAGDHNIKLQVDTNYGVIVNAYGGSSAPFLSVNDTFSHSYTRTDVIQSWLGGRTSYNGDGSWTLVGQTTPLLPIPPQPGAIKYFCKPTKSWLTAVKAVIYQTPPTWTIDGTNQILTCSATGTLVTDTITGFSIGDRVLVNLPPSFGYNGPYTVTNPGGVGVHAVLTRASDGVARWQLFDGLALPVVSGAFFGGKNVALTCPTNYNATNIDGSTALVWALTSSDTLDQFCIMFSDGQYNAISTSSVPYSGSGAY